VKGEKGESNTELESKVIRLLSDEDGHSNSI
jgi:hypothetical protein